MQQTGFLFFFFLNSFLNSFSFLPLMFERLQSGTQQRNYSILMKLYDLLPAKSTLYN